MLYSIPEVYYEDGAHWFDLQLILFANFTLHFAQIFVLWYVLQLFKRIKNVSLLQCSILFEAYSKKETIQDSLYYCSNSIHIQMCVCKSAQACLHILRSPKA